MCIQMHVFAYNLGNFLRTLPTPETIKDLSLTTLKEKLIKSGAKVVSLAGVAISRHLFADILQPIAELRPPLEVVIRSMSVNFPGKNSRP
jgi:hypothetical protein